jgi:hypothetical protein
LTVSLSVETVFPPADSAWWWMRYQGRWGSIHTRIRGSIGVDSPWRSAPTADGCNHYEDIRWRDPAAWRRVSVEKGALGCRTSFPGRTSVTSGM